MSANNPFISFCIPTYNRSGYLKKCIESIIGYQGDDIEIIIQDNCSPDDTFLIASSFKDSRIKYFKNIKNIGPVKNLSAVIKNAIGEFIYLLTDDDMLIPGSIEIIMSFAKTAGVKAFKSALITLLEKSLSAYVYSFSKENKLGNNSNETDFANILYSAHIYTGLCFRRDLFDEKYIQLHDNNWYPSIALMGCAGRNIGFLSYPTAIHIWENETFWGIDPQRRVELNQGMNNVLISLFKEGKIDIYFFKEICRIQILKFYNMDHSDLIKYFSKKEQARLKLTTAFERTRSISKSIVQFIKR